MGTPSQALGSGVHTPAATAPPPVPLSALTSPTTTARALPLATPAALTAAATSSASVPPPLPPPMAAQGPGLSVAGPGVSIKALAVGGSCESLLAVSGSCSKVSLWRLADVALGVQCTGSDDEGDEHWEGGGDGSEGEDDREEPPRTRRGSTGEDGDRRPAPARRSRLAAPWGSPAHVFATPHDYVSELCWRGNQVWVGCGHAAPT
jgi:hypothetical protein